MAGLYLFCTWSRHGSSSRACREQTRGTWVARMRLARGPARVGL